VFLRLSTKYDINSRLAGLMVAHGSCAGNFSPVNPLGAIVNGTVARSGLSGDPSAVFAGNFIYNVVVGVFIYVAFGGIDLVRRGRVDIGADAARGETAENLSVSSAALVLGRVATLVGIVLAAVGALVFRLDLGMLTLSAAVVLHLLFPGTSKGAFNKVNWGTVVLICGVVTYMALMQRMGTIKMVGDSVAGVSTPMLGALAICAVAAVTSAFASSAGVIGVLIPLSVPLLSTGEVNVIGVIIALAISATVVDASPFSAVGALVLANCPERDQERMFRDLFLWGMLMVVTAPLATSLFFVFAN
jgi:di/tricarboxylate transporter